MDEISDVQLREKALAYAVTVCTSIIDDDPVKLAMRFYEFLKGGQSND